MQVLVKTGLVDGIHCAQAHGHRGELPKIGHQPRVWVGREAATWVRELLAETIELVFAHASFEEGACIDSGGGVTLEIDLVATARVIAATEEVVETDFVQRGARCVGGNVSTHTNTGPLCAVNHDRGVPTNVSANTTFNKFIAREPRLGLRRNGVDVVGAAKRGNTNVAFTSSLQQRQHEVARTVLPLSGDEFVERITPLFGFVRVNVNHLVSQARMNDASAWVRQVTFGHGGVLSS